MRKKLSTHTERDRTAQVMGFGRLDSMTVHSIRYENHFSANIHKQTKIFITEDKKNYM